jgi:hypothetical protein
MQHPIEASLAWSALILAVPRRSHPGISGAGQPNSSGLRQPRHRMRATHTGTEGAASAHRL